MQVSLPILRVPRHAHQSKQHAHNLEQLWQEADSENQRLIEAADVTVSGELIKVRLTMIFAPCMIH